MRHQLTFGIFAALGGITWAVCAFRDWHARIIANAGKDPMRWE
ncbi:MAG: hypothetical protein ACKVT1_02440 [Dehalococcoidia bacterium]